MNLALGPWHGHISHTKSLPHLTFVQRSTYRINMGRSLDSRPLGTAYVGSSPLLHKTKTPWERGGHSHIVCSCVVSLSGHFLGCFAFLSTTNILHVCTCNMFVFCVFCSPLCSCSVSLCHFAYLRSCLIDFPPRNEEAIMSNRGSGPGASLRCP